MNERRLKEIEDICNAATPGPWWVEYRECTYKNGMVRHEPTVTTQDTDISVVSVDVDAESDLSADAAFIANARGDVPALIAEVRRLRRKLEAAYGAVDNGPTVKADITIDANVIRQLLDGETITVGNVQELSFDVDF